MHLSSTNLQTSHGVMNAILSAQICEKDCKFLAAVFAPDPHLHACLHLSTNEPRLRARLK
jgi:hypothetical protein